MEDTDGAVAQFDVAFELSLLGLPFVRRQAMPLTLAL